MSDFWFFRQAKMQENHLVDLCGRLLRFPVSTFCEEQFCPCQKPRAGQVILILDWSNWPCLGSLVFIISICITVNLSEVITHNRDYLDMFGEVVESARRNRIHLEHVFRLQGSFVLRYIGVNMFPRSKLVTDTGRGIS